MLTGKDLIEIGLKPGPAFPKILSECNQCSTREDAIAKAKTFLSNEPKATSKPLVAPGSVLEWFLNNKWLVPPFLEGRTAEPSNSEIRRVFENKAVIINGIAPPANALMQLPIWQLIWFPKSQKRCTMVDDTPKTKQIWCDTDGNPI